MGWLVLVLLLGNEYSANVDPGAHKRRDGQNYEAQDASYDKTLGSDYHKWGDSWLAGYLCGFQVGNEKDLIPWPGLAFNPWALIRHPLQTPVTAADGGAEVEETQL